MFAIIQAPCNEPGPVNLFRSSNDRAEPSETLYSLTLLDNDDNDDGNERCVIGHESITRALVYLLVYP